MAQNLFEKYGIKEVADVTLYRIERKDETYESQRKIPISSILKGALTVDTVYPLDEDKKGADEGFQAYVFKNADVLSHFNYDCDDEITIKGKGRVIDLISEKATYEAVDPDHTYTDLASADFATDALTYYGNANWATNVLTALKTGSMTLDSAFDEKSYRSVKNKLEYWINNTTKFEVANFTISKGSLVDTLKTTVGSELDKTENFEDLNRTYTYTYTLDPDKAALMSDSDLPTSFTISATEAQYRNEAIRYERVRQALATEGIVIADRDLIGYYFITRSDGTPTTGTLYLDPNKTQTVTITTFVKYEDSADAANDKEFNAITTYTLAPSNSQNPVQLTNVPIGIIRKIQSGLALSATDTDTLLFIQQFVALAGVTTKTISETTLTDSDTKAIEDYLALGTATKGYTITITSVVYDLSLVTQKIWSFDYTLSVNISGDADTGIYDTNDADPDADGHYVMDADTEPGTHEFSYAEQACMLFAKNQNLITKRGTRYQFANPDAMFGDFEFNDEFAIAPNGRERIVVCGLVGKTSENLYDLDEINDAFKAMTDTIEAKAYDVVYTDYAELVVEDEMGYYIPDQLGRYDRAVKDMIFFGDSGSYVEYANTGKGVDLGLAAAVKTWGDDTHYSINDAIDALKQEIQVIDGELDVTAGGFSRIFGGYLVKGKDSYRYHGPVRPTNDAGASYQYRANGLPVKEADTGVAAHSGYSLDEVLAEIARMEAQVEGTQLRVDSETFQQSNRAIYVDPTMASTSARANIYLLRNIQAKSLATDTRGIFEFYDKKGNKVNYQDVVFAGTEYLALVTIGAYGLIFVVERHGTKNIEKVAWMINENGYLTDKQAERIVKNGLIHTVDVTVCDESFDATCTVGSIKVRKTKKNVLHYVPVLFLDTLKVSTLEQAAESTDATGGRGNAKLITWDYGKEITLSIEDALYTPASMAAIWGGEHGDLKNGVKDTHMIDRMEKITAKRSFIVPAGNSEGTPTEGNVSAQAVYYDPKTMEPFQDGTPIAEGEVIYKFTRSVAYDNNSIGNTIEISADGFPGTYRVVGETMVRDKATGEDQRFQFIIPEAKMSASDTSITLEADGDPVVFDFTMNVLRPENGIMMKFVQFDVVDNEEENDGSTMVKDTENLNLLDDAEMYKVSGGENEELIIGATEY